MFTIYSKLGCPYCDKIEKVFKMKGFEYTKQMLGEDFGKEEFYEQFGVGSTFPRVLDSSGNLIGGATETVAYLKKEGLV